MRNWVAAVTVMMAGTPALALPAASSPAVPATSDVRAPVPAPRAASEFRLKRLAGPVNPTLQLDDPRSMLKTGYGGSMIDLFPLEGGKLHISGGGRLFGRAGRPGLAMPESYSALPSGRAGGLRGGRRFSPALLIGYGRTVERGLALGFDAGVVMGKLGATPDRMGRLNRRRLDSVDGRGRQLPINQLARLTALYRF